MHSMGFMRKLLKIFVLDCKALESLAGIHLSFTESANWSPGLPLQFFAVFLNQPNIFLKSQGAEVLILSIV